MIFDAEKPFRVIDCVTGRAKVLEYKKRHIIALPIKESEGCSTQVNDLKQSFRSLKDVIRELGLSSISICKGNVTGIVWKTILAHMQHILANTFVKIFVCTNKVAIPPVDKRESILTENHCSAIGGHKGIGKTYQRVRHKYFWPNIKKDVQNFVQNCRDCQLKKLVRIKHKQPMILTDTPDAAFDHETVLQRR